MLYHKLALEGLTLQDAVDMATDVHNSGIYDLMQNVESAYNPQAPNKGEQGRKPMHYGDIENENTARTVDRVGAGVE